MVEWKAVRWVASHSVGGKKQSGLPAKGKSILRAITAPGANRSSQYASKREAILRALTDDAYT